jgi:3-deoxy-manno-octulosonate cytidylyltransferase (CMP-KDO synthetase)
MRFIAILPVRLESTRLPNKALKVIENIPAIIHAYKRTSLSKYLSEVYIATDSKKIQEIANKFNCKTILTKKHRNGSERIFEASKKLKYDYLINVQGDEVLIDPKNIDKMILEIKKNKKDQFFLGVTDFKKINQKNVFKAVTDNKGYLLYCSREDIPSSHIINNENRLKVVFVVGFKKNSLEKFVRLKISKNEKREPNEFLRILDNGLKIKTVKFFRAQVSLDTKSDLKALRKLIKKDKIINKYC